MKRLIIFSFIFFISSISFSQSIKIIKKDNRIKGGFSIGYGMELEGKSDDVENSLSRFLKDFGKVRASADYMSISGPNLGGVLYDRNSLYATTEGDEIKCRVWIGLDTAEWRGHDLEYVSGQVEKIGYQFGVKYYRDKVQKEIDESQRAFDATEKKQMRLVNQNKDLNLRVSNNEQERIHLERSLEVNKLEKAVLLQKLENNKKSQDSVAAAGVQIKKVMEAQKEKQKRIN